MHVELRHRPAFAVAHVLLDPGEAVSAEAGAMMATSDGVTVEASTGGLVKGLRRSLLGGDSMYVSRFTAPATGGWVDVAASLPGDLVVVDVAETLVLTRGSWLCSSVDVELEVVWGGMKNLLGGEGGFQVRAHGPGTVVASCYGGTDALDLAAGEHVVVDSGHLVAYEPTLTFETRDVSSSLMQSLKSGERLVFEFTGPGRLWVQSRSPRDLVGWLAGRLPFKRR